MCDGSFRRYRTDDVKDYLKWLIIRNDGNPIPVDNLPEGVDKFYFPPARSASLGGASHADDVPAGQTPEHAFHFEHGQRRQHAGRFERRIPDDLVDQPRFDRDEIQNCPLLVAQC